MASFYETSFVSRERSDIPHALYDKGQQMSHLICCPGLSVSRCGFLILDIWEGASQVGEQGVTLTGAYGDAGHRRVGHVNRHAGFLGQQLVEVAKEGTASNHRHTPVDDVGCELRRGSLQDGLDHINDEG